MSITIRCPNPQCAVTSTVGDAFDGRSVKCKRCGTPFVARATTPGTIDNTLSNRAIAGTAREPLATLPTDFGRYRVLKLLGKGGMGAVYLAQDSQLGRRVALKLPTIQAGEAPESVERLLREARSAAALHHPNICTLYDVGWESGRPYLTMLYVEGTPLSEGLDPEQPMSQRRAAILAQKIAGALAHAHAQGIIHRDLKPANVMLTAAGEPIVMDFGLARRVVGPETNEAKLTQEGMILGTPAYMAPEQIYGEAAKIGPHSDVYALGVLLFELLTGRTPFRGTAGAVLAQVVTGQVPSPRQFRADVDERLEAICRRAMAKEPRERFASMKAVAAALDEYLSSGGNKTATTVPIRQATVIEKTSPTPAPTDVSAVPPLRDHVRRWVLLGGIGGGVAALLVVVVLILLMRPNKDGTVPGDNNVKRAEKPESKPTEVVKAQPPVAAEEKQANPTPPFVPAPQPAKTEWMSLFNGKDLTGWMVAKGPASAWLVKEGELVAVAAGRALDYWLFTDTDYDDFVLRFEYRMRADAHASGGITFRALPTDPMFRPLKLMDDGNRFDWAIQNGERTGSLWAVTTMAPPRRDARLNGPGEWNEAELILDGKMLTFSINGERVQHLDLTEFARQAGDFPTLTRASGRIGLQAHTSIARFRNLRLRPLRETVQKLESPTASGRPELVALSELPVEQHKSGPWPSADGLTLYWSSKRGKDFRTWVATRKDLRSRFENIRELLPGYDPTVTADQREMILAGSDGEGLFLATRLSDRDAWSRPSKLHAFDRFKFMASPCLSPDGLTLYAEQFGDESLPHVVRFRRPFRQAGWDKAEPVTIKPTDKSVRFPSISADLRLLFGCAGGHGMLLYTASDAGTTFGAPVLIDVPGSIVRGKFPRYVPATHELFFCEDTPGQKQNQIYIIRNFDRHSTTKPLP